MFLSYRSTIVLMALRVEEDLPQPVGEEEGDGLKENMDQSQWRKLSLVMMSNILWL